MFKITKIDPAGGATGSDDIARNKFSLLQKLNEAIEPTFDLVDVESKLRQSERVATFDEAECTAYVLEDGVGNMIKVWIPKTQETEFSQALSQEMATAVAKSEEGSEIEIGEVLFNLKDKFDIVNIEWPEVGEDQDDTLDPLPEEDADGEETSESDIDSVDIPDEETEGVEQTGEEVEAPEDTADQILADETEAETASTSGLLTKLMDLLKTQAEADKARSKAEISKNARDIALRKMKQEEEVLDMDAYNQEKKDLEKEAKKLKDLARFRQETSSF